ncbi:MAG: transposase [Algicola sp.]|nr:transposase [Algicola sp.]
MTQARSTLIDYQATRYYHTISRCIRRAYLCGKDELTGKSFEHRRQWLVDRFKFLAANFTIDICAYAVMSNHYHLVLKVDTDESESMSDDAVIKRWTTVYTGGNVLVERHQAGAASEAESRAAKTTIDKWRTRLSSISWFMGSLNQHIASRANKEDQCTGHFWESRFKSQALLDDMAVLGCMMYVDLNPVRAGIAKGLGDSEFTSIQERIKAFSDAKKVSEQVKNESNEEAPNNTVFQPKSLLPFTANNAANGIHFSLIDYLALVETTDRCVHPRKKGYIDAEQLCVLKSLNIDEDEWLELVQNFEGKFAGFAGKASMLYFHANQNGQLFHSGVG